MGKVRQVAKGVLHMAICSLADVEDHIRMHR